MPSIMKAEELSNLLRIFNKTLHIRVKDGRVIIRKEIFMYFSKVSQCMQNLESYKLSERKSERWTKISVSNERGTVNEAELPDLFVGECHNDVTTH
jgi:hypothetical protein